ncbi:MAG: WD40/YVTN/BNR-like repeat-containing protein, partial [Pyrinomonadaceae bacterium]
TNVLDPVNRAAAIARSTTSYIQDFSCNISGVCLTIVSDTGAEFLISNDWGDNWKKEKIKLKTVEAIHVNNVEFFRFRNGEAIWMYGTSLIKTPKELNRSDLPNRLTENGRHSIYTPIILESKDNGKSWQKLRTPMTLGHIEDIFMASEHSGWAIFTDGIYKFFNRGGNLEWKRFDANPEMLIDSNRKTIQFVDAKTGWFTYVGESDELPSKLYKTLDGGKTWKLVFKFRNEMFPMETGAKYITTIFKNDKLGFVFLNGKAYRTNNGGNKWYDLKQMICEIPIVDIVESNENDFYFIDKQANIYKQSLPMGIVE